jgi:hypothetical protein
MSKCCRVTTLTRQNSQIILRLLCQDDLIHTQTLRMRWSMPRKMGGELMLAEVTVGVKFIALIMTKHVEVEYFAYPVFGVLLEIQGITQSKLGKLLTTVQPTSI